MTAEKCKRLCRNLWQSGKRRSSELLSSARLWSEGKAGKELDAILSRTVAFNHCLNSKRGVQLSGGYMKLLRDLVSGENEGKSYPV